MCSCEYLVPTNYRCARAKKDGFSCRVATACEVGLALKQKSIPINRGSVFIELREKILSVMGADSISRGELFLAIPVQ
jgi:hypothetical protein